MQDKVVMGDQKDGLRGLTRFSDNEGDIIWPAWRAELKQRVAFEFGKIGNQIIEGEVKESDVDLGEVTEKINALINALIPKTRAQIQTRSDWMEEVIASSEAGASDEERSITGIWFSWSKGEMSFRMFWWHPCRKWRALETIRSFESLCWVTPKMLVYA